MLERISMWIYILLGSIFESPIFDISNIVFEEASATVECIDRCLAILRGLPDDFVNGGPLHRSLHCVVTSRYRGLEPILSDVHVLTETIVNITTSPHSFHDLDGISTMSGVTPTEVKVLEFFSFRGRQLEIKEVLKDIEIDLAELRDSYARMCCDPNVDPHTLAYVERRALNPIGEIGKLISDIGRIVYGSI